MALYEQTLDKLEAFVAEQAQRDVEDNSKASTLLDKKETELLLQQRYMQQLQRGAGAGADGRLPAPVPDPGLEPGADEGRRLHGADSDARQAPARGRARPRA